MGTLLEALTDCSFDLQNKRDTSGDFARKLLNYRNIVVENYVKKNLDLNKSIANIAKDNNLNDDQIHRIVAEVNNQVYLILYDKKRNSNERDVEFDIASLEKVKKEMGQSSSEEKTKLAFESYMSDMSLEKVASVSENNTMGCLGSGILQYSIGSLADEKSRYSDEKLLNKIAEYKKESDDIFNKKVINTNEAINKIAAVVIDMTYRNKEVNPVFSKIARELDLNPKIIEVVNEKIASMINEKVKDHLLYEGFEAKLDLDYEKTASEKFSLGKFSFIKSASENEYVESFITDGIIIKDYEDIFNLVKSASEAVVDLNIENKKRVYINEKLASVNLQDIDSNFVMKLKEEKLLSDKASSLRNVL